MCIKGVDFGNTSSSGPSSASGTAKVVLNVAADHKGGSVEFRAGHFANGELLAKVEVGEETTATADFTLPAEKLTDLFVVLNGDVELVNWSIQ